MNYLWDTCVISDLAKSSRNEQVSAVLAELPLDDCYLSVMTLGEIEKGIRMLPSGKRQLQVQSEMARLVQLFEDRILPVTPAISRRWGMLDASIRQSGGLLHVDDGLLAATAIEHDLVIVTRNVRDFRLTGVGLLNPWAE